MIQELINITDETEKLLKAVFELLEAFFNLWNKKGLSKKEQEEVANNTILKQLIKTFKNEWETGIESKQQHIIDDHLKNDPKRAALFSAEVLQKRDKKLTSIIEKDPKILEAYNERMRLIERNKKLGIDDSVHTYLEQKDNTNYLINLQNQSQNQNQPPEQEPNQKQTANEKFKRSFEKLTNKDKLSPKEETHHKNVISKSPLYSFKYAKEVQQPFPEGEKAINEVERYREEYNKIKESVQKTNSQSKKEEVKKTKKYTI